MWQWFCVLAAAGGMSSMHAAAVSRTHHKTAHLLQLDSCIWRSIYSSSWATSAAAAAANTVLLLFFLLFGVGSCWFP